MWKFRLGKKTESPDRQPRIEVEIPINFRNVSEFAWNLGKSNNLSRSGVLFRAVQPLMTGTQVEVEFVAPPGFGPDAGELVACRGRVVRTLPPAPTDRRTGIATKFSQYQVLRRPGEW